MRRLCFRQSLVPVTPLCVAVITTVLMAYGAVGAGAAPYSFARIGEHTCSEAEAGQLCNPVGVGVDGAGNVYVGDLYDYRVDKFDRSGRFLLAWGLGVLNGANELQVCTTECQAGKYEAAGFEAAGFQPLGVAVDSSGNVYVFDWGHFRVEKFDPNGKFLSMFGGHVNKNGANICTEKEKCQPGTEGTGNGEFGKSAYLRSYITVGGPAGDVYVGEQGRVQVFDPSGAYREKISLTGLSSTGTTGTVSALAVNPAGDVFVKIGDDHPGNQEGEVPGVRELEPSGTILPREFDAGSKTIHAIAVDNSGNLYVGDTTGGFHILKYEVASGLQLSAFGFGTATDSEGMAFSPTEGRLYGSYGNLWAYTPPGPGPVFEPNDESCKPEARGAVMCEATVNPEGSATNVEVEFTDEAEFTKPVGGKPCEWSCTTTSSSSSPIGSSFEDQHVVIKLPIGTLIPGVTYHWRLVASNTNGTQRFEGPPFKEVPATLVDGPWVTEVESTSATFLARINPSGVTTSYRLEYGTSTAYETELTGSIPAGEAYVLVSYHRQGLSPSTTYHYRLMTTNAIGKVETADQMFTTQPAVALHGLSDGRVWELVSPIDKHAALIEPAGGVEGDVQAAAEGDSVGYLANEPMTESPPGSAGAYVLSARPGSPDYALTAHVGSQGWGSQEILPSQILPEGEKEPAELLQGSTFPMLFSRDLTQTVIEPNFAVPPPSLSPQASERTIFLHDVVSGAWTPLVTTKNDETGEPFGGELEISEMKFLHATPDLSHVVFASPFALTKGALRAPYLKRHEEEPRAPVVREDNLYEWNDGRLAQVNVLPDGSPTFSAYLGRNNDDVVHAMSNDGRWVAWEYQDQHGGHALYVRDMVAGSTVQVGGKHAVLESMSNDGSRFFFLDGLRVEGSMVYDLYEFDAATGVTTDVTGNHGPGEIGADVKDAVVGTSEDGSYVYFVASGVLANGGVKGEDNLYVAHQEGGVWNIALVTTLSGNDEPNWSALQHTSGFPDYQRNELITSRVSPNGRFVVFMSNRSLTGYDNVDANPYAYEMRKENGKWVVVVDKEGRPVRAHDEEVYEYDALTGKLVCASCNPSGARPVGVFDTGAGIGSLLVDRAGAWRGHGLAGSMVGWREVQSGRAVYQSRNLSDSGRLFFESPDALVPLDTNGLEDVYEYEPVRSPEGPSSNDCVSESQRFNVQANGCVNLISSGTSGAESTFYDASTSGDDVFFLTASKLVPADYDNSFDVYDAHVCSIAAPCLSEGERPAACDSGECKPPPSPQPTIFGPAPSATFSGPGNVPPPSAKPAGKRLTRAQELRRALKACRKRRRRQRATCERRARARYARKGKGARRAGR